VIPEEIRQLEETGPRDTHVIRSEKDESITAFFVFRDS
jgi:hypothetical protein